MKFFDLDGKPLTREDFVELYSKDYFSNKYSQNNKVFEEYIEKKCNKGEIDFDCIAWKFGKRYEKLEEERKKFENEEDIMSGRKYISGHELKKYLDFIKGNQELSNLLCSNDIKIERKNIEKAFDILSKESPYNFGTVYIITVMFFLSKGKIPIYDRFAHISVEAIINGKKPREMDYKSPPDKNCVKGAIDMLCEYMECLEQVFGKPFVSRKEDQALWAYGHKK